MTDAKNIRSYMAILNEKTVAYSGARDSKDVTYSAEVAASGEIKKVIAQLQSYDSGRYTKLGRNLKRIERINARITEIKEEVKQDTRELIADLFHAEDACRTRMVETVGFIFQLTKDPKASVTYKYSDILEELTAHLTPELITVMEAIKKKYGTTNNPKPPSLSAKDKVMNQEGIHEGFGDALDKIKGVLHKFYNAITNWGRNYDEKLDRLQAQAAMVESVGLERKFSEDTMGGEGPIIFTQDGEYFWTDGMMEYGPFATRYDCVRAFDAGEDAAGNMVAGSTLYDDIQTEAQAGLDIGRGDADIKWGKVLGKAGSLIMGKGKKRKSKEKTQRNPFKESDNPFHIDLGEDDWDSQDDLQDYNDAEADDYRDEGDEPDSYESEMAVYIALEMMGVGSGDGTDLDGTTMSTAQDLISCLNRYSKEYSISPSNGDDSRYEFDCSDQDNVNSHYNPIAVAWLEHGQLKWNES